MSEEVSPSILPQDLITTEVLPRLPVESIGRFKCVSELWNREMSTPQFAKAHLNFHKHDPEDLIFSSFTPGVLLAGAGGGNDAVYRAVNSPMKGMVFGSCHGLVLLLAERSYILCMNPITLEALKVPSCPYTRLPPTEAIGYGVGYDSSTDDYKIVSLLPAENGSGRFGALYSVKRKSWKRIGFSSVYKPYFCFGGVFINGCIYWRYIVSEGPVTRVLMAFNMAREEFEEVLLPDASVGYEYEIGVVEGCLALFNMCDGHNDVWVLRDYGVKASWTILTTVKLSNHEVVHQLNEDELVIADGEQLRVYNWRNEIVRAMDVANAPQNHNLASSLITRGTFKRSLISPNMAYGR